MQEVLIIAGAAGFAWAVALAIRGSLVALSLATIVITCCFGFEFWHAKVGGIPLTLDRLAQLFLAGAFILQTLLRRTDPKPVRMTDRWLGFFLVWLIVSTFTHDYEVQFLCDAPPVFRLLAAYLIPGIVYWIAKQSPLTEQRVALVYKVLTLFGIYLAVTGILEITQQWSLVFPRHIADPAVGIHFGRARGPMVTAVSFGLYLAVCFLAALYYLPRLGRLGQLLLIATFPLFGASLYFSYTRSVWIGISVGLMITLAVVLRGRLRVAVLGLMLIAAAGTWLAKSDSIVGFKREQSAEETRNSAEWRKIFAYVSWEMFQERPILGFGFGHFPHDKLEFLSDRSTDLHLESIRDFVHHNTFLCLLTETGSIGLGLFLLVFFSWARDGLTLARSTIAPVWARRHGMLMLGALGIYGSQLLFHELSYSPLDNLLIFFLAGVLSGLEPLGSPEGLRHPVMAADPLGRPVRTTMGTVPSGACPC